MRREHQSIWSWFEGSFLDFYIVRLLGDLLTEVVVFIFYGLISIFWSAVRIGFWQLIGSGLLIIAVTALCEAFIVRVRADDREEGEPPPAWGSEAIGIFISNVICPPIVAVLVLGFTKPAWLLASIFVVYGVVVEISADRRIAGISQDADSRVSSTLPPSGWIESPIPLHDFWPPVT